jgi:hypothetical protein
MSCSKIGYPTPHQYFHIGKKNQMQTKRKMYAGIIVLLMLLMVLLYLFFESRQRSRQIENALKQIPSSIK